MSELFIEDILEIFKQNKSTVHVNDNDQHTQR